MSLRNKMLITVTLAMTLGLVMFYVITQIVVLNDYAQLEERLARDHAERVRNTLDSQLGALSSSLGDWSYWTDTYNYVRGDYPDYIDMNVLPSNYESLRIYAMIFLDENGEWYYGETYNPRTQSKASVPETVQQAILNATDFHFLPETSDKFADVTSIIPVDDEQYMIVSRAILQGTQEGEPAGTLIWLRLIDNNFITNLEEQTKSNIDLFAIQSGEQPKDVIQAMESIGDYPYYIEAVSNNTIAGYSIINDLDGKPVFVMRTLQPRLIYLQGSFTTDRFFIVIVIFTTLTGFMIIWQLNMHIFKPLDRLQAEVKRVNRSSSIADRIHFKGQPEIETVATLINDLLTQNESSQRALMSSQERLHTVMQSIPLVLFTTDTEGIITHVEGKGLELLTVPVEEQLGKPISYFFPSDSPLVSAHREALNGKVRRIIVDFGDYLSFEVWLLPKHNEAGVIGVALDYTERRQSERVMKEAIIKAEEASRAKSQFLATMSHELRTPLNSVLNFSRFVYTGVVGPVNERQQEMLMKVESSGKHLLSLINDVLDISRIEAGGLTLDIQDNVNLSEIITTVSHMGDSLRQSDDVSIVLDVEEKLPQIVGDKRRLQQVLLNLVSNACKFTEQGSITISARRDGDEVIVAVKDTGIGIASKDHDAVFEAFRQNEDGLKQGHGSGLGLAISRSLIYAHRGDLWLESELGKGATFFMRLPIHSQELLDAFSKNASATPNIAS